MIFEKRANSSLNGTYSSALKNVVLVVAEERSRLEFDLFEALVARLLAAEKPSVAAIGRTTFALELLGRFHTSGKSALLPNIAEPGLV